MVIRRSQEPRSFVAKNWKPFWGETGATSPKFKSERGRNFEHLNRMNQSRSQERTNIKLSEPSVHSHQNTFRQNVKISAQPHATLCIQFLDRKNNDKNNTLPLGKQICFTIVWGYAEILSAELLNHQLTGLWTSEHSVWTWIDIKWRFCFFIFVNQTVTF